ncbi:MAG: hypothetical protein RSC80_06035 [Odoribacter sp.]
MRTLGKLKLLVLSAFIFVGMTSCLKTSDPDFGISGGNWYVLQQNEIVGTDTTPEFAPYIIFSVNESLAKATVSSQSFPAELGGIAGKITGSYWESNTSYLSYKPELLEETYKIAAYNAAGEMATFSFQIGVKKDKAIGVLKSVFSYDSSKGLTVKWTPVKNANYYELSIWDPTMSNPRKVAIKNTTDKKEFTFDNYDASKLGVESGKEYKFELVAYNIEANRIKIKLVPTSENKFSVTWAK